MAMGKQKMMAHEKKAHELKMRHSEEKKNMHMRHEKEMRKNKEHEMVDNRRVKDDHKEGIARVIQRRGDLEKGQGGKMTQHSSAKANWRRTGGSLTPRQG